MAFAPRKKKSARYLSPRALGVLGALTVGASLLTAPQALAADAPTNAELLKACSWASFCKFRPQSYWGYTGPAHQVGSTAYNCGSQTYQHRIDWSDTTTASNTVGVSVTAGYKFAEVFEVQVETTLAVLQAGDLGAQPAEAFGEVLAVQPGRGAQLAQPRTECLTGLLVVGAHPPRSYLRKELLAPNRGVPGGIPDLTQLHDARGAFDEFGAEVLVCLVEVEDERAA